MQSAFATTGLAVIALVAAADVVAAADASAFPGAEGFGAVASGGRGGDVYYVTNLNDRGPGSLREGLRRGDRTILFQVSGTIDLTKKLNIEVDNVTIAGQSAPGDGICIRGKELSISGKNIVVRFLRIRPGDELGEEHDALTIQNAKQVMIDHCSLSWSVDSLCDVVRDTGNVTVQWCILAEPLNKSAHHKGAHGYGTGWGSGPDAGNSFHHNLLAHCNSRSPRIGSEPSALVDVRNNVIYNLGDGWAYGGERADVNYVANYYKPGPGTRRPHEIFRISSPETRMYLADNFVAGDPGVTQDNRLGIAADKGVAASHALVPHSFAVAEVATQPAGEAYESVLQFAGAMRPRRDAVDERIVADVRNGTGQIIDSPRDVGGWPELESAAPNKDSDGDGLPDDWEREHQRDPHDAEDANSVRSDGYTRLEHYLNHLAAGSFPGSAPPNQASHEPHGSE
jgi:pectate lyase